jgi:hypothetical protein
VRRIGGELLLTLKRGFEPGEHGVEHLGQAGQFHIHI